MNDFQRKIQAWMDYRQLSGNHHFYTREQWNARGETIGNNASLTLVTEGRLQRALCGYCDDSAEIEEELQKICDRNDWHYEIGYSWSIHFYEYSYVPS